MWKRVSVDRTYWTLLEVTADVLHAAQAVIERYPLRSVDAIHVASAQVFALRARAPVLFVSADARQLNAASALGFETAEV